MHAEAVLLVDDRRARARGTRRLPASAHACRSRSARRAATASRAASRARSAALAAEPDRLDAERREPRLKCAPVLLGEQFGRRHQRDLVPGFDRGERRERRDDGLARADIALHEPQHRRASSRDRARFPPTTRCCARVSANGSFSRNALRNAPSPLQRRRAMAAQLLAQALQAEVAASSNSSNASRCCAGCARIANCATSVSAGGRCTVSSASRSEPSCERLAQARAESVRASRRPAGVRARARSRPRGASGRGLRWSDRSASGDRRSPPRRRPARRVYCGCTISSPCAPWRTSP